MRSKQIIENFKIKDETNTESDDNDDSDNEKSTAKDTSKNYAREEKESPSKSKRRKVENKDKISENVQVEFFVIIIEMYCVSQVDYLLRRAKKICI